MARKKELYLKDAFSHLSQSMNILGEAQVANPLEVQNIRAAARQAEQAATVLNQLAGALDAGLDRPAFSGGGSF